MCGCMRTCEGSTHPRSRGREGRVRFHVEPSQVSTPRAYTTPLEWACPHSFSLRPRQCASSPFHDGLLSRHGSCPAHHPYASHNCWRFAFHVGSHSSGSYVGHSRSQWRSFWVPCGPQVSSCGGDAVPASLALCRGAGGVPFATRFAAPLGAAPCFSQSAGVTVFNQTWRHILR